MRIISFVRLSQNMTVTAEKPFFWSALDRSEILTAIAMTSISLLRAINSKLFVVLEIKMFTLRCENASS